MWAYRLVKPGQFERVDAEPVDPEGLEPGEVLLRILAGGICGSDIPMLIGKKGARYGERGEFIRGRIGHPLHEVVGAVVASRHDDVPPGAHVVGWASRGDGLAQWVASDGNQLHTYDPALTPQRAVLLQPLACVLAALDRVEVTGRTVAVLGLGPIGLLFAHAAKSRGAARVTGIDPVDRSRVAAESGLDDLVVSTGASWAEAITDDARPEVVIEAVGHQVTTLDDAVSALAPCGTLLYFGIPDDDYYPLHMERVLRKHLTIMAGVTRNRRRALADADAYLRRFPELNDLIVTHRFDAVQPAYDVAATTGPDRLKVTISFAS